MSQSTQVFWDEEDEEEVELSSVSSARLIRIEHGADGEATPVPPPGVLLAIGRNASESHSCNLVLHDPDKRPPVVSAKHAQLENNEDGLQLILSRKYGNDALVLLNLITNLHKQS